MAPRAGVPRRELAVVAGVALAVTVLILLRNQPLAPGHENWLRPWDHRKYLFMAEHPFSLRLAPFSWRLLGPWLAGLLPVAPLVAFRSIAFVSIWLTAVVLHVLLRRQGHPPHLAAGGMLAFLSVGWATGYPLYNSWLPDALAFLVVALAVLAARDQRPVAFAALLVVGVLARETVLFVAPLWYGLNVAKPVDRHRLVETIGLAVPAVVVGLAVRLLLPAANTDAAYVASLGMPLNAWDRLPADPVSLFEVFGEPLRLPALPALVPAWIVGVFGTLPLLAAAAGRRALVTLLRWSPFLLLVLAQPLFAANTLRLVALAFPAVVVVATDGLAALERRLRLSPAAVVAIPLSLVAADLAVPGNAVWFVPELLLVGGLLALGALLRFRTPEASMEG